MSEAYFDNQLQAWVLSRYSDVMAAFRSSNLSPAGSSAREKPASPHENHISQMRSETRAALSPAQLSLWNQQLQQTVDAAVSNLPANQPVDLVASYARPSCLTLASIVTGISPRDAKHLHGIAEPLSTSAAEPFDPSLKPPARVAAAELRPWFRSGPEPLRDSGFVALAHTLPALLTNCWFALVQHPQQWTILRRDSGLIEQAVEELLRCAGLPNILFRKATEDVQLNGASIRKGETVILRITEANRDPERFSCPHALEVTRRDARHLSLGAGPHSCVGAGLIRMAAVTLTRPLVQRFAQASLHAPVEWRGGSGFRSPNALWVVLTDPAAQHPQTPFRCP